MKRLIRKSIIAMSLLTVCFLVSCTTYKGVNFKVVGAKDSPSVQVDIVGVNAKEYKRLEKIDFNTYWHLAFTDDHFLPSKATFYFDVNRSRDLHAIISGKLIEKWQDNDSEYLMIFAHLPIMPVTEEEAIQKNDSWKITIPFNHFNPLWFYQDSKLNLKIFKHKIEID